MDMETLQQKYFELDEQLLAVSPVYKALIGSSRISRFIGQHFFNLLVQHTDKLYDFLLDIGVLKSSQTCHKCFRQMTLSRRHESTSADDWRWKCNKRLSDGSKCNTSKSFREGSWFTGSKLPILLILNLTYEILKGHSRDEIQINNRINSSTITDWRQFVEECLVEHFINNSAPLGGEGVIVEIDESKFGKRKYNRGRQVEGQWVLGGVERGGQGRVFLVPLPDNDRSAKSLIPIIQQYVLPGTIVMTDLWRGYSSLGLTYKHFVYPDTGAHTNTIGLWRLVKENIPGHNRQPEFFNNRLGRFLFERHHKRNKTDIFLGFLDMIRRVDWTPEGMTPNNENIVEEDGGNFIRDSLLDKDRD